ncbi:hypothetical protein SAMD00019534_020810 [Acytostelium subglobosum LB1]|uniref:hypothetical protein n=1 Tax=Acytostelium subglobosum LB1 TaxID=1410327 RepID=UPI000644E3D9|nr:hypothetical protein SAMD00019534_020810 [Acytostelium subglobosum LB1]GAM18906.1 hypothetical protein SAMD00019534_020810 [Acytostelium subglobosum LB1]|eukprot:XP_012758126.1 hypothetical protein SAMD00019534_020810 [Acytostelium subglobosum LB1]
MPDDFFINLGFLQSISLDYNKLKTLPKSFKKLQSLQILRLAHNSFKKIPKVVLSMTSLQSLNMSGNKIGSIPKQINQLVSLKELYLSDNRIRVVPDQVARLSLFILELFGNPIISPPSDIVELGLEAIMDYLRHELTSSSVRHEHSLEMHQKREIQYQSLPTVPIYHPLKLRSLSSDDIVASKGVITLRSAPSSAQLTKRPMVAEGLVRQESKMFSPTGHSMMIQASPTAITNTLYTPKPLPKIKPPLQPKEKKSTTTTIEVSTSLEKNSTLDKKKIRKLLSPTLTSMHLAASSLDSCIQEQRQREKREKKNIERKVKDHMKKEKGKKEQSLSHSQTIVAERMNDQIDISPDPSSMNDNSEEGGSTSNISESGTYDSINSMTFSQESIMSSSRPPSVQNEHISVGPKMLKRMATVLNLRSYSSKSSNDNESSKLSLPKKLNHSPSTPSPSPSLVKSDDNIPDPNQRPKLTVRNRRGTVASELDIKHFIEYYENTKLIPSMIELLRDSEACDCFRSFLMSEYSVENLDFWLRIEKFKKMDRQGKLVECQCIYNQYINDKATSQVNLPSTCVKRVEELLQRIDNGVHDNLDTMFNESQFHIFTLMETDSFERYKKSNFPFKIGPGPCLKSSQV